MRYHILLLLLILSTRSYADGLADLYVYASAITPLSYAGESFILDEARSESDEFIFDVDGGTYPALELEQNNDGSVQLDFTDSEGVQSVVYRGGSPSDMAAALSTFGFMSGSSSGSSGGSSTVTLDSVDAANLQGSYQVLLWIFGALLMLPIVLGVKV